MEELGGKFWLWVVGVALAIGIGGMIIFVVLTAAWYAWGALGALLFFGAVLMLFAWIYDRRQVAKAERLYDDVATDG